MKRVFVVSDDSIFWTGIHNLLGSATGVEIVGSEADPDTAAERVRELQPDVIVFDQDRWPNLPVSDLMGLLGPGTDFRIVGLSLRDRTALRYRREARTLQSVEDLMDAFE